MARVGKVGIKRANYEKAEKTFPFTKDYSVPKYPVVRLKDVESFTEEEAIEQIYSKINNGEDIRAIKGVINRFYNNDRRVEKAELNEAAISTVRNLIIEKMEKGAVTNFSRLDCYFMDWQNPDTLVTGKRLSAALRELVEDGYLIRKRINDNVDGYCECYIRTNK